VRKLGILFGIREFAFYFGTLKLHLINMDIQQHPAFLSHNCELIVNLIGGSNLYGLNTPESDIDYRSIFIAKHKRHIAGFDTINSIVQNGEVDFAGYELGRFLQLLRKSNTQVLEILYATNSSFNYFHKDFKLLQENRERLIDTKVLESSLQGYVHSELNLATGKRSGRLGGKRKNAVEEFGFSPKNFVQILRLCNVGIVFFNTGEYMVKVKDFDEKLHDELMDIKINPQGYTKDHLEKRADEEFAKLNKAIDSSKIKFEFDIDLACDILMHFRA